MTTSGNQNTVWEKARAEMVKLHKCTELTCLYHGDKNEEIRKKYGLSD